MSKKNNKMVMSVITGLIILGIVGKVLGIALFIGFIWILLFGSDEIRGKILFVSIIGLIEYIYEYIFN